MNTKEKILAVNDLFYQAFNQSDLDLMRKIWHPGPNTECIHPGWGPLQGLDAILQSWSGIFSNPDDLQIKLSHVKVEVGEDLAWVGCQENLFIIQDDGVRASAIRATNLFRFSEGKWLLVLHHASSIPGSPVEKTISNN